MKDYELKKEDFKEIFQKIVFFRNSQNIIVEVGYVEYNNLKFIKFYLINGGIYYVEGVILIDTLNKVQRLLTELDIKDLD